MNTNTTPFHTSVSHNEMINVLIVLLTTQGREGYGAEEGEVSHGLPFFILDEPGTGKTTITRQLGYYLGYDLVEEITLTQRPAEDVGGYGVPNRTRDAIIKIPDACFKRVNEATRALLVFDEFGSVEEDKRAACLRVTSERSAGDLRLGGHVRMCAIGNPESSAANANPLDPATANRYIHIPWVRKNEDDWTDWAMAGMRARPRPPIDPDALEAKVRKGWDSAVATAAGVVTSYIKSFKDDMQRTPMGQGENPESGEADQLRWPSARIWEYMIRAIAGGVILGLSEVETDFMVHCILPAGVAKKFCAFRKSNDVPAPEDVLSGKVSVELSARMDRTHIILKSTASRLASRRRAEFDPADPEAISSGLRDWAVRWWELCAKVKDYRHGGRDFVVPAASFVSRSLDEEGAGLNKDIIPEAAPVVGDMYEILLARSHAAGNRVA